MARLLSSLDSLPGGDMARRGAEGHPKAQGPGQGAFLLKFKGGTIVSACTK